MVKEGGGSESSLILLKATAAASVQSSLRSFPWGMANRLLSGPKMEAQFGMKRWWKLTSPRNSRSFRSDIGIGKSVIALTYPSAGVIP